MGEVEGEGEEGERGAGCSDTVGPGLFGFLFLYHLDNRTEL